MAKHTSFGITRLMAASSALMISALAAPLARASDIDATETFSAALSGAFTFSGQRAADDIPLSFMHFTKAGRLALIDELQRTGVVAQAVAKKGSLKAFASSNKFISTRRVGPSGVDEYEVKGEVELQWNTCEVGSCVPTGPRKKAIATGTVVQVTAYGRPAFKISNIALAEVAK